MREKPEDKGRLLHILEAINNLFEFTDGLLKNINQIRFCGLL